MTVAIHGGVPSRYANKRMLIICGAIAAVIVLVAILRVLSTLQS